MAETRVQRAAVAEQKSFLNEDWALPRAEGVGIADMSEKVLAAVEQVICAQADRDGLDVVHMVDMVGATGEGEVQGVDGGGGGVDEVGTSGPAVLKKDDVVMDLARCDSWEQGNSVEVQQDSLGDNIIVLAGTQPEESFFLRDEQPRSFQAERRVEMMLGHRSESELEARKIARLGVAEEAP